MAITGGNGNIGQKIASHLLRGTVSRGGDPVTWHVKLLDDFEGFCKGQRNSPSVTQTATGSLEHVQADLRAYSSEVSSSLEGVDVVVHLQAWNPYPEATWEDSRLSMDMTANAIEAARAGGVRMIKNL